MAFSRVCWLNRGILRPARTSLLPISISCSMGVRYSNENCFTVLVLIVVTITIELSQVKMSSFSI